jgi:hypothetical protein
LSANQVISSAKRLDDAYADKMNGFADLICTWLSLM